MRTVAEVLRWRALQHPQQIALRHEERDTTYAQLDRRANVVANALLRDGLQPGQRVCVLDKSHDVFFEVLA